MKSFHANLGAGIDGLSVREHDIPEPGPTEVLVQVHAASLSFRELMILRGWYPLPVKPDVVPISDGAGEVIAVGERVTHAAVGDRVIASIFPRWIDGRFALEVAAQLGGSLDGMLTEYTLLGEDALVRIPDHLSYEEGATLPCARSPRGTHSPADAAPFSETRSGRVLDASDRISRSRRRLHPGRSTGIGGRRGVAKLMATTRIPCLREAVAPL